MFVICSCYLVCLGICNSVGCIYFGFYLCIAQLAFVMFKLFNSLWMLMCFASVDLCLRVVLW